MTQILGLNRHVPLPATLSATLCAALLLSACGDGQSLVRTSEKDGGGPLLQNCQTVNAAYKVEEFITEYYLSTWGSAWMEGANQGLNEGLRDGGRGHIDVASFAITVERPPNLAITTLPVQPLPYCRKLRGTPGDIARAARATMAGVGRTILPASAEATRMDTAFAMSAHRAATWWDKYAFLVTPIDRTQSELRIQRLLFIARDGKVFNQASSNGWNEAWIMAQVERRLASSR